MLFVEVSLVVAAVDGRPVVVFYVRPVTDHPNFTVITVESAGRFGF